MMLASSILILPLLAGETGLASWYGGKFQGRPTANGEIFDTNKLTAAHKSLPFGTMVKVVNSANSKSVVVRINDRGPFVEGRIIDLSRAAAEAIGLTKSGVAEVSLSIVKMGNGETYHKKTAANYSIQVGAFQNPVYARNLQIQLRNKGIETVLDESTSGLFRVVVAGVPADLVDEIREDLAAAGFPDVFVKSAP